MNCLVLFSSFCLFKNSFYPPTSYEREFGRGHGRGRGRGRRLGSMRRSMRRRRSPSGGTEVVNNDLHRLTRAPIVRKCSFHARVVRTAKACTRRLGEILAIAGAPTPTTTFKHGAADGGANAPPDAARETMCETSEPRV